MPRKKVRRYGDYTQIIDGNLYAVVNLRQPNGKYKKKYKKVENKTAALQWALDEIDKHKKGASFDDDLIFPDFADWYVKEFLHAPIFENGIKVSGIKNFDRLKNNLERMKTFFGERKMRDFNEYDLRRWADFRRTKDKVITATLNRDFALLRTMFRKGLRYRKILSVPQFEINLSAEVSRERILTFDEEKRLLAACVNDETITKTRKGKPYETTIKAKREHLRAIIILAVDSALRLNEMFTLTWADIDFDNETISVQAQNTKRQVARKTLITPRSKDELLKLYELSDKKPTSKIFNQKSPIRAFRTACARANIKDLHFHDLRHCAITRMIRAGIPHTEVMKMSGHTTMKSFMRYLNLVDSTVQNASAKMKQFLEDNQ